MHYFLYCVTDLFASLIRRIFMALIIGLYVADLCIPLIIGVYGTDMYATLMRRICIPLIIGL